MPKSIVAVSGIALATSMLVGACWLWAHSHHSLGERAYSSTWVGGMRCASVALILAAHALLAGVVIPSVYRPRTVYSGAALCTGGMGILGGVAALGLLFAGR